MSGKALDLAPQAPATGSWSSDCREDPWAVTLAEKGDLLEGATRTMQQHGADIAEASHRVWDTRKWLVSSEGSRVDQHIVECGAAMSATAVGERESSPFDVLQRLKDRDPG